MYWSKSKTMALIWLLARSRVKMVRRSLIKTCLRNLRELRKLRKWIKWQMRFSQVASWDWSLWRSSRKYRLTWRGNRRARCYGRVSIHHRNRVWSVRRLTCNHRWLSKSRRMWRTRSRRRNTHLRAKVENSLIHKFVLPNRMKSKTWKKWASYASRLKSAK